MKLLLDTHIWLWSLSDPKRLGRRVVQHLKDEANELWLSPISAYEALTLHHKKDSRSTEILPNGWRVPLPAPGKRHSHTRSRSWRGSHPCIRIPPIVSSRPLQKC